METAKVRFGTDGIRGTVGQFPITPEVFTRVGQACRQWLQQKNLPLSVAVGWDTRASGPELAQAFARGFGQGEITFLNVTPTPAISFYVVENTCSLGVSITASHNPYTDNGLKLFKQRGSKLSVAEEAEIEALCLQEVRPDMLDFTLKWVNGSAYYLEHFKRQFSQNCFSGKKIVLDTANGATTYTTLPLLRYLGFEVIALGAQPDGTNINRDCGSEFADRLQKLVVAQKAWLGFAHDGDGDRLVVIDEDGCRLDGDEVLGLLAIDMKQHGDLLHDTIVVTSQSNSGLQASLESYGIKTEICDVGDRSVFYKMLDCNSCFGGESSGHIILKKESLTGDGLRTLLKLLRLAKEQPLKERKQQIKLLPKLEDSLRVTQKIPLQELENLNKLYKNFQKNLGRVYIRYSGTENKLRLLVEAETDALCRERMDQLKAAAKLDFEGHNHRGAQ
ncbi:MAG: phosphoglucosamine mutase [bacterium]